MTTGWVARRCAVVGVLLGLLSCVVVPVASASSSVCAEGTWNSGMTYLQVGTWSGGALGGDPPTDSDYIVGVQPCAQTAWVADNFRGSVSYTNAGQAAGADSAPAGPFWIAAYSGTLPLLQSWMPSASAVSETSVQGVVGQAAGDIKDTLVSSATRVLPYGALLVGLGLAWLLLIKLAASEFRRGNR